MERLIMMPGTTRPVGVPDIIRCSMNPSDMKVQREAGLVNRPSRLFGSDTSHGTIPGSAMPGATCAFGGEGRTTLNLQLMFETYETVDFPTQDVREQTEPLYRLSTFAPGQGDQPCPVDLIWGKTWSFRGVVNRLSETLDRFTIEGVATRSWLNLEFLAVNESWPNLPLPDVMPVSGDAS